MNSPIIITGAAQRLGRAIALALAADGFSVVATYRSERHDLTPLQQAGIECIAADFSSEAGTAAFIESITARYTRVRAIIHNASSWESESSGVEPQALFQRMMQIHATTPYCINQALAPLLQAAANHEGWADIIHMTDYIVEKGSAKHIAYAASKAALQSLTLSFAQALAPLVKVNSIAPALLMFNDHDDAEYRAQAAKKSLLAPAPGAEEAVAAVRYLLSSRYVTGRVMALDGGRPLK
ncbi:MAG: dihydromonapterin reductase [Gammaproteobacteria bacterium]|nr:dihydromonapterin reductase [Gammaproteobacteria bacterium]